MPMKMLASALLALAECKDLTPAAREHVAIALRNAVELAGEPEGRLGIVISPRVANAVEGIAATLSMAADHAAALADGFRITPPPP